MFAGSSFTISATGYRYISQQWELLNYPGFDFTFPTPLAIGGNNTWSNLVRLTTGDDTFIIDHANDDAIKDHKVMEALIRRVWAGNNTTRIILVSSPTWTLQDTSDDGIVTTPTNETALGNVIALAAHYGIPLVDYWGWCKSVVPGTYHLNELTDDATHPNALGYANMAALLEAYLPNGGQQEPSPLPDRLYDDGGYERTPTQIYGTDYDSRTGSWTDTGTRTESSTVGDTITFSATCQSIGCWRADGGTNHVTISVDGGAFTSLQFYQNGIELSEGYGSHTFVIKVDSGTCRIDEFWAI